MTPPPIARDRGPSGAVMMGWKDATRASSVLLGCVPVELPTNCAGPCSHCAALSALAAHWCPTPWDDGVRGSRAQWLKIGEGMDQARMGKAGVTDSA